MKKQIEFICKKKKREVCGLIYKIKNKVEIVECANVSINPTKSFEIAKEDFLKYFLKYKILAIFHSHVETDEHLSSIDILMSEEIMIPFWVYSLKTKKHNFHIPKTINKIDFQKQLEGVQSN